MNPSHQLVTKILKKEFGPLRVTACTPRGRKFNQQLSAILNLKIKTLCGKGTKHVNMERITNFGIRVFKVCSRFWLLSGDEFSKSFTIN